VKSLHQISWNINVIDPLESHRELIRTTSRGKRFPKKSEDDPDVAEKHAIVK